MVKKNIDVENYKNIEKYIPKKYINKVIEFIHNKRYGTISLIIQDGKVVGCDILEKDRIADR